MRLRYAHLVSKQLINLEVGEGVTETILILWFISEWDSSWDENDALDSYLEIDYSDENAEPPSSTFFFLFENYLCYSFEEALIETKLAFQFFLGYWCRDSAIPVGLVENSGRCNKNENDEKILPNGDAWIPSLVKEIVGVATNGKKSLLVDEKLVNGSESNDRGKIFIPLILGVQWLLVKWIQREIKKDIVKGGKYI
ncbi:hypothetical protein POTOM_046773 [Populus tomentosa]|uniref:Uncharacterized protein n=1 Tax=Populus tomentosa TaxID=118781 RepID=A0A8X8C5M0_POPTO|nr:hypothetical protein POTOM_046773 [Populus tomentosa]